MSRIKLTDNLIAWEFPISCTDFTYHDDVSLLTYWHNKDIHGEPLGYKEYGIGWKIVDEITETESKSGITKANEFSIYTMLHAKGCVLTDSNKFIILKKIVSI